MKVIAVGGVAWLAAMAVIAAYDGDYALTAASVVGLTTAAAAWAAGAGYGFTR